MSRLRIATRSSKLAGAQAIWVGEAMVAADPELTYELIEITTTGDLDQESPVAAMTEMGAFVRAVQHAVLDDRADIAVHSCKDMPVTGPPGLASVHPRREAPNDVLVGSDLAGLVDGAIVGTGSPRRAAQLRLLKPEVEIRDIRGNVDTRIRKLEQGMYDAIVLAEAGLNRIGRRSEIAQILNVDQMVPAPAQGTLAVETRANGRWLERLESIRDEATTKAVQIERGVLERTGAGCRSALAVYVELSDSRIRAWGFTDDEKGPRRTVETGDEPDAVTSAIIDGLGLAERNS